MPSSETLTLFTAAAIVITLVPGPSMLYVMSRSIDHGRTAGIFSTLGLATGLFIHTIAASLGLSVIFIYSPLAYSVIKYLGAIYLIYLGIHTLLAKESPSQSLLTPLPPHHLRVYGQGIIIELLNPKTALFFLSFLPQFVDPAVGSPPLQMLILGSILIFSAFTADLWIGVSGRMVATWLESHPIIQKGQQWAAGMVLLGLGARLAVSKR